MSLQGTLDTFSLPDVLRFLAASAKTGRLEIDGPRGAGDLWVDGGNLVAGQAGSVAGPIDAVFELLRDGRGSFTFSADLTTSDAGAPLAVEEVLAESEARLAEWREIEAVVPSLSARVDLAAELSTNSVRVTAEQWRALVAVSQEGSVGGVGRRLDLGEFDVSKLIKGLVEQGLVEVDGAAAIPPLAAVSSIEEDSFASLADVSAQLDPEEAEAVVRQLAALSPEAAEAVERAQHAATPEEREAALEGVADDDPVNRGLLLKFLSSVRS